MEDPILEFLCPENLPPPLFAKEGCYPSLWQREDRRDFMNFIGFIIVRPSL